jgi:hypothetical protein
MLVQVVQGSGPPTLTCALSRYVGGGPPTQVVQIKEPAGQRGWSTPLPYGVVPQVDHRPPRRARDRWTGSQTTSEERQR